MQIGSIIAVYFIVWWLTFVMVLPIGNQSHHEAGTEIVAGGDPASPIKPRLIGKFLLATALSAVFTAFLLWGLSNETLQHYWNR